MNKATSKNKSKKRYLVLLGPIIFIILITLSKFDILPMGEFAYSLGYYGAKVFQFLF